MALLGLRELDELEKSPSIWISKCFTISLKESFMILWSLVSPPLLNGPQGYSNRYIVQGICLHCLGCSPREAVCSTPIVVRLWVGIDAR